MATHSKNLKGRSCQRLKVVLDTSSDDEFDYIFSKKPAANNPPIENSQESISSAQDEQQARNSVQRMLQELQGDIIQSLVKKSKTFQRNTNDSLKSLNAKLTHIIKTQQKERQDVHARYAQRFLPLFQQWEKDVQNSAKEEEKFLSMCQQQAKNLFEARMAKEKQFKEAKKFHEQFLKGIKDLDENRRNLITGEESEVKKEMDKMRKKILKETQQQDIAAVEKCFQSLLPESGEERAST